MHIIEKMSLETGSKINKPFIYEKYFPITYDKYICIKIKSSDQDFEYKHWEEVLDLCQKDLNEHGYGIIAVGKELSGKSISNRILNLTGLLSFNQIAYVIKNSSLYVGPQDYECQLASFYAKKMVLLSDRKFINFRRPYWSDDKDLVSVNYLRKKDDLINAAKPEKIADAILSHLNINKKNKFETIFIGKDFLNKTFEIIPDKDINIGDIPIDNPIVRMDYFFNENILEKILKHKKTIIFTNQDINGKILEVYRSNIDHIIYNIEKNHNPKFIEKIKNLGIKYSLTSELDEESIRSAKIDYIDLGIINKKPKPSIDNALIDRKNLKYKSSRLLISGKFQFYSKYDWENSLVSNNLVNLNDEFLKEIHNFYIFTVDSR